MRVFVLKTCDTCRRALRELRAAGHQPQVVDLRAQGVDGKDLARWRARFGDALLNRRSTTWRNLSDAEKSSDFMALLQAHPSLIKRPVIEAGEALYLGWGPETRAALLG